MKIIFHGHAFLELETDRNILLDPFITGNPLCEKAQIEFNPDHILLTHGHRDHYGDTEQIASRTKCPVHAIAELARWISQRGFSVVPFNLGGSFFAGDSKVTAVQAIHSNSTPDGTYGGIACGFIINHNGKTIYAAGDTSYFSDMRFIGERYDIDIAFLPIGGTYTMDTGDLMRAASDIRPGMLVPIHYNTFDLLKADTSTLSKDLESIGVSCTIMEPGSFIII